MSAPNDAVRAKNRGAEVFVNVSLQLTSRLIGRVLVVHNHSGDLETFATAYRDLGLDVSVAQTGCEAVALAGRGTDFIILGSSLLTTGCDGLVEQIWAAGVSAPVVIVTTPGCRATARPPKAAVTYTETASSDPLYPLRRILSGAALNSCDPPSPGLFDLKCTGFFGEQLV